VVGSLRVFFLIFFCFFTFYVFVSFCILPVCSGVPTLFIKFSDYLSKKKNVVSYMV
jgi:hypothetical protein